MEQLDITYSPVISPVSGYLHVPGQVKAQRDVVVTSSPGKKMVLHQPRDLSLPNNEEFRLLLRALSPRLAGYALVTTVIECSRFYKVDGYEWMGAEGAPQGGDRSTESGTSMPLCSIAVPQPWRLHLSRRERFKIIRSYFSRITLRNATDAIGMVDMLVMFGLDYLQKLVGEITFFERLPSIMQALRRGEPSVDDGSPTCLSSLSSVSSESWDSLDYVDLLSEWKGPRYETGTVHDVLRLRRDDAQYSLIKKEAKQHDLEFISVSLSTKLLEFVYVLSSEKWGDGDPLGHTDFDMVRNVLSHLTA
ncbi:hypothetical protein EDD16DRAFT_1623869 [Pisolithus croceorrhizus]|nr:hypothetical protein EDD16DRAFT_1623869 [Pisolithus croceorrhizus]